MSAKDDLAHPSSGPASSSCTVSHLLPDAAELEELPEVLATGHRVDLLDRHACTPRAGTSTTPSWCRERPASPTLRRAPAGDRSRFALTENHGYLPPPFTAADYQARTEHLNIVGGAVVSGSFQGFDQTYLLDALTHLGPGSWASPSSPPLSPASKSSPCRRSESARCVAIFTAGAATLSTTSPTSRDESTRSPTGTPRCTSIRAIYPISSPPCHRSPATTSASPAPDSRRSHAWSNAAPASEQPDSAAAT